MKKTTALIAGILMVLLGFEYLALLMSCSQLNVTPQASAVLQVTEQEWAGWERVQPVPPEPVISNREIKVGDKVELEWHSCGATVTIEEISEDYVRVHFVTRSTTILTAEGIDLSSNKHNWSEDIAYDTEYRLATQTMDAGMTWVLVFKR